MKATFKTVIEMIEGGSGKNTIVDLDRGRRSVTIYQDNKTTQERFVIRLSNERGERPRLEVSRLVGFDPVKNRWGTGYHRATRREYIYSRKGEKAFYKALDAIIAKATRRYPEGFLLSHDAITYYFEA